MERSDFYCTKCGNKGIPVVRARDLRESGHLKMLYCTYCKKDTNHAEIRQSGSYSLEDFIFEFENGNFNQDGNRIDSSWRRFIKRTIDIKAESSIAERIARYVEGAGGRTYYVGGFVRDKLLGMENKDVEYLLDIKTKNPEIKEIPRMNSINMYLDKELEEIRGILENMKEDRNASWPELNEIFMDELGRGNCLGTILQQRNSCS